MRATNKRPAQRCSRKLGRSSAVHPSTVDEANGQAKEGSELWRTKELSPIHGFTVENLFL